MEKVSCFIRKNTPELRKRIEDLGIELCCCASFKSSIYLDYDSKVTKMVHGAPLYDEDNEEQNMACFLADVKNSGHIDCGENEEMFLALIALRDDTDKNQWFIYESPDYSEIEWCVCEEDNYEDYFIWDCMFFDCRKATAQDIIEHFKTK